MLLGERLHVTPAHLPPKSEGQTRQLPSKPQLLYGPGVMRRVEGKGKLKSASSFTYPSYTEHQMERNLQRPNLPSMPSHQQHDERQPSPSPSLVVVEEESPLSGNEEPLPAPMDDSPLNSEDDENHEESPSFSSMMDFIFNKFPEARGPRIRQPVPSLPGIQDNPYSFSPSINRAPQVDYMMDQAYNAISAANYSNTPALARVPSRRFLKAYRTFSATKGNKVASVNQELHSYVNTRNEPRVSFSQAEAIRLEEAWLKLRDIQNFLCWTLGAFADISSSPESVAQNGPMIAQMVKSIQRAMNDQLRVTAFSLANTRLARRESYLALLPKNFNEVSKAQLRRSVIDSDLLFEGEVVKSVINAAQNSASASISAAAVKALEKSNPRPSTSVVERRPTASTSTNYRPHSFRPNTSFRRGDSRGYRPRSDNKKPRDDKRSGGRQPFRK